MGGVTLLDFLKTAKAEASTRTSAEAPREAAKCRWAPLPEVFALPRRFGVPWGCLAGGVFNMAYSIVGGLRRGPAVSGTPRSWPGRCNNSAGLLGGFGLAPLSPLHARGLWLGGRSYVEKFVEYKAEFILL